MYFCSLITTNSVNLNLLKKHIAFVCLLVLSIPALVQSIHLFEDHEHFVCTSDIEQHYHENIDLDCSQFHYQFEIFSGDIATYFDTVPTHFYTTNYNEKPQTFSVVYHSKKTTRGPPLA